MDKWRWLIFGGICALIFGLVIFMREPSVPFEGDPARVVQGDHVYGDNTAAKVVLVEYADFQCPGCESLYQQLKAANFKHTYKDKVAFVYRYLPLTNLHPNAKAAAAAAEAAARQGKFWEMHDFLYNSQSEWGAAPANTRSSYFERYASGLGLNMKQFKEDVGSKAVSERIRRDAAAADKAKIEKSTPALVLNGKSVSFESISTETSPGQRTYDIAKLETLVDKALQDVGEQPPVKPSRPETTVTAPPATQSSE